MDSDIDFTPQGNTAISDEPINFTPAQKAATPPAVKDDGIDFTPHPAVPIAQAPKDFLTPTVPQTPRTF